MKWTAPPNYPVRGGCAAEKNMEPVLRQIGIDQSPALEPRLFAVTVGSIPAVLILDRCSALGLVKKVT
jgi:hypothetical protein